MDLKQYFEQNKGLGILATADSQGNVDAAIYARPHVIDENTVAFIMRDHLTYHNLQSNPHACYLFREETAGYTGKRIYLTKKAEDDNIELIESLSRRQNKPHSEYDESKRTLVYFTIDRIRHLVGDA
jgi:hypothetical protein